MMTTEEIEVRTQKIGMFFTAFGVDASEERVAVYVEQTRAIPWKRDGILYFLQALGKCVREKNDGYQTAPSVGEIWDAAESFIPSEQRRYSGTQGSGPPRWFSDCKRLQAPYDRAALKAGDGGGDFGQLEEGEQRQ